MSHAAPPGPPRPAHDSPAVAAEPDSATDPAPGHGLVAEPLVRRRSWLERRWRAQSLRKHLVALMLLLLAFALAATAFMTVVGLRHYLMAQTDAELQQLATTVAPLRMEQLQRRESELPSSFSLRIVGPAGKSNALNSWEAQDNAPELDELTPAQLASREMFTVPSEGPDGPQWRLTGGQVVGTSSAFVVAVPLAGLESTIHNFVWRFVAVGLALWAATGLSGWLLIRRALAPVAQIQDTAAAIAAGDRSRRIREIESGDEVASLARSLNAMLSQIEQSLDRAETSEQRMRQFIADASHELRTPLVAIRGYAELHRQGAISGPQQTSIAMGRIEDESRRMSGLVEDLLMLARLDRDEPPKLVPTDLAVIAGDAVQDARAIDHDRDIRLQGLDGRVRPVELLADDRRIRQVVTNLVVNAMRHTPAGTPVEVVIGKRPGGVAILQVRDHGHGIDPAVAPRIFERFYRTDASRARDTGGSGLGLAIVAAIVQAHKGRISVTHTPGGGATFVVELPTGGSYLPPSQP